MNALSLLLAYLLGSIPFGYLIVKLRSGADIRETGSGGTGATNVSRKAGKAAGVVTLALDLLKGAAAVLVARWLTGESGTTWIVAAASALAVIGHCFPVWLKFKAGKGVATGLGVFLAIAPWAVLAALAVFLVVVWRTRFVSLGSILAAAFMPLWVLLMHLWIEPIIDFAPIMTALCAASAVIIFKHSENIKRLMAGEENKFGMAR
ncbi:MAG TPA: glycerol-3-phosphate 1-O-acyltransferase PlsY [Blastocatellia bacterium]|nr:glycerol-3-phosphate 1-O-acyltransferase PlsY [Blastocatellia bacterium]